jgi:hypothetical protein
LRREEGEKRAWSDSLGWGKGKGDMQGNCDTVTFARFINPDLFVVIGKGDYLYFIFTRIDE